jgi:hypothetical protein
MNEKQIFFTILTKSYLPLLKVLSDSLSVTQTNYKFIAFIFDSKVENSKLHELEDIELIYPEDIEENFIESNAHWLYKYSIIEACTAVKPQIFKYLFKHNPNSIINYVDPDLFFINQMQELNDSQNRNPGIYLTPHLLQKEMDDDSILSNELSVLKHGIFNLGFISIADNKSSHEFLNWWEDRLIHFGEIDYGKGLFTDQKWVDLAPSLFENVYILKNPGYNVSTWNIKEREFHLNSRIEYRFIHVSGFYSGAHSTVISKLRLKHDLFEELLKEYYRKVEKVDFLKQGEENWKYGYNKFGEEITDEKRQAWKNIQDLSYKKDFNPYNLTEAAFWKQTVKVTPNKQVALGPQKGKRDLYEYYAGRIQLIKEEIDLKKIRIVHIWHGQGGGVEEAVRIFTEVEKANGMVSMSLFNRNANFILKYSGVENLEIEIPKNEKIINFIFSQLGVNNILFHSLEFNFEYEIFMGINHCFKHFFMHDFSLFNENWNFMKHHEEIDSNEKNFENIFKTFKLRNQISVNKKLKLLSSADKIIVASNFTKKMCITLGVSEDSIRLISIPEYFTTPPKDYYDDLGVENGYIGVIADISEHKGEKILKELSMEITKHKSNLKILIYGNCDKDTFSKFENIVIGGSIPRWRLKNMLRQPYIKILIFPFLAPETYSFALSDAISSGKPLVVPDGGVFAERTAFLQNVEYVDIFSKRSGKDWFAAIENTLKNKKKSFDDSSGTTLKTNTLPKLPVYNSYISIFSNVEVNK